MAKDDEDPEYEVGYKRPPLKTRFKPGKSGNPSGRPKNKDMVIDDFCLRELNSFMTIKVNKKPRRVRKADAIGIVAVNEALKGNFKFLKIVREIANSQGEKANEGLSRLLAAMRNIDASHDDPKEGSDVA